MTANAAVRQSFFTALTDTKTTDVEGVGTLRTDQFGNVYRWVYNQSTTTSLAGQPACFDASDVAATFYQNVVGMSDIAAGDEFFLAGVFISAIPTLNYGWILVSGKYDTARLINSAAVAGGILEAIISTTDTTLTAMGAAGACFAQMFAPTTTAGGSLDVNWVYAMGKAVLLDVVATATTATSTNIKASILIRGVM